MKLKHFVYCLLAFVLVGFSSCEPDNEDYADKVVGDYDMKITPNLKIKLDGNTLTPNGETIETTCSIMKENEEGNVTIYIDGVNGMINEMQMKAFCSGLGMNIEDSNYDGIIYHEEYGRIDCDIKLANPNTSISNAKILSWESTVSGICELNYSGLPMTCEVSGTIGFYATVKK